MNQRLRGIWLPFIARSCCLLRGSRKGQTKRRPLWLQRHPACSPPALAEFVFLTVGSITPVHARYPLPARYRQKGSIQVRFQNGWDGLVFLVDSSCRWQFAQVQHQEMLPVIPLFPELRSASGVSKGRPGTTCGGMLRVLCLSGY